MNENFNMDVSGVKAWRTGIKILAYLVYMAGALFATITFSQHVSGLFPEQPIFRFMAFAGAWANFFSLAIMPLAKEYWVNGRAMSLASWLFWVVEFLMVVFNVLAAYGSGWATWWNELSPASPVIVIAVWGLLWYLNPEAKVHQEQVNFFLESQRDFQKKLARSMKSSDIQKIMDEGAAQAARQYAEKSLGVVIDQTYKPKQAMVAFNQETPAAVTAEVNKGERQDDAPTEILPEDGRARKSANPTSRRQS